MTAGAAPEGGEPLRIVLVIARYPPHHLGGYELRCRDVARELGKRGHAVTVLTSTHGAQGVEEDDRVRVVRELHLQPDGVQGWGGILGFLFDSRADCARLRREMRRSKAQVVSFWHMSGLSAALLAVPGGRAGVVCDVSSDWLQDVVVSGGNWFRIWERRPRSPVVAGLKSLVGAFTRLVLRVPTRRPQLPPGKSYFTSKDKWKRYLAAGVAVHNAEIITSGIDIRRFKWSPDRDWDGDVRLLFLGRIKRRKGLHTVVLALGDLPRRVKLRCVGPVEDQEYMAELAELARAADALDRVEFAPPIDHADVPAMLADCNVLVFPSEEPEAFSRLVLEAFSVGTPVVGTTLGGTGEVLVEGVTGLTFEPGNSRQLAQQLERVIGDAALREGLVASARKLLERRYSIGFTVDQIEAILRTAAG